MIFKSPKWILKKILQQYSLREFWIARVLNGLFNFCKFSCLSKIGSGLLEFGSRTVSSFEGMPMIQWLSIKPAMLESLRKGCLFQINKFCCLRNFATSHRIYLRINLSKFSKLYFSELNFSKVCFILGRATLLWRHHSWWNFLFFQNHIFNKKRKSFASFFLVLCLTPFVADITFITLLLSQIYVCMSSHSLINVQNGKQWVQP